MRIVIRKGALKSALRSSQWVLGAAAALMLGYCGLVLADSWLFQKAERRQFEQLLHDRQEISDSKSPASSSSSSSFWPPAATGGLIGRIEIPRLGVSVIVVEGVDRLILRRSVGHIPGTAQPGQSGNVGISGHRDTFFRPLRNIRRDDIITLTTLRGAYRYRVVSTKVVSASNVDVLDPSENEILTLVTCYPFYFVGPAPDRFIVRAERVT
ncbi:MAG: class D sortase [Bryobacteraceae bacterium]|jgi:sortase A